MKTEKSVASHVLCWIPETDKVRVLPLGSPELMALPNEYCTGLAAYVHVRKLPHEMLKLVAYVEAMHLIVRDGCDPMAVHRALLQLKEYRDGCAPDMPGPDDGPLRHVMVRTKGEREATTDDLAMVFDDILARRPRLVTVQQSD